MSRSGSETRKLDTVVAIRMTSDMYAALGRASSGGSVQDHIRGLLSKDLGIENRAVGRPFKPPLASVSQNVEEVLGLRDLALATARSLVALKLVSEALRDAGSTELAASAEASLIETQQTLREIYLRMAQVGVK